MKQKDPEKIVNWLVGQVLLNIEKEYGIMAAPHPDLLKTLIIRKLEKMSFGCGDVVGSSQSTVLNDIIDTDGKEHK